MHAMATTFPIISSFSSSPFFKKNPPFPTNRKQRTLTTCKAKDDDNQKPEIVTPKFDRRNILLGLSGLYSSTSLNLAFAAPPEPDFTGCVNATEPNGTPINCCPPGITSDLPFYTPTPPAVTRTRVSAQSASVDRKYVRKYARAIEKLKRYSSNDPRNFYQQANVHCAYCDGGYNQLGYPDLKFEVHNSWIFFPWHRWYLYFFERICQDAIDDDTFALPFWNWDSPAGMEIPAMYNDRRKIPALYDVYRNPNHLPPTVIDLLWDSDSDADSGQMNPSPEHQRKRNLYTMYKQMVLQSKTPTQFFGEKFVAGQDIITDNGPGSIESIPHNTVHSWTGTNTDPDNAIDMGVFYSAARDPIFYAHHGNVDRMWTIWLDKLGGRNFKNHDWLNTYFIFYNEKKHAVKVRIRDCLDLANLGYTYEDVDIPWLNLKPTPRRKKRTLPDAPAPEEVLPIVLDEPISVLVKRPRTKRSKKEKEEEEEVLVIDGIEYDKGKLVKFNVYVDEDDVSVCGPEYLEFVGAFTNVPHGHSMNTRARKRFAISSTLEELGADDLDSVLVTLVPKQGRVRINGIRIEFESLISE